MTVVVVSFLDAPDPSMALGIIGAGEVVSRGSVPGDERRLSRDRQAGPGPADHAGQAALRRQQIGRLGIMVW